VFSDWNQPISLCYGNQNLKPHKSLIFTIIEYPESWNEAILFRNLFCWKDNFLLTCEPCRNRSVATKQVALTGCAMLYASAKPADSKRNGYYPLLHKNRASWIHTSLSLPLSPSVIKKFS
jgi:hypothetical protein